MTQVRSEVRDLHNNTIILTDEGKVARVDREIFSPGRICLIHADGVDEWVPANLVVTVIATLEEALAQFMAMKQAEHPQPPAPVYDAIMELHGAYSWRDMRGSTPADVLANFAARYPTAPAMHRYGWVARIDYQDETSMHVGSWQQILHVDGEYILGEDEGAQDIPITPLELG